MTDAAARTDAEDLVLREDIDGVARLTLNAPARINPLSEAMLARLQGELDALSVDASVRAVVLRGAGKAFCAGHDLKEMQAARQAPDGGRAYYNALFAQCGRMMTSITRLPQPVIAEVHGIATAAGCQLVATCDMAVAADSTRFGVNGVNIGLFCSTPMVALTRNVPAKHAFEMLTTGEFISAARAAEIGLINRAVPDGEQGAAAMDLAARVAGKLGVAVRTGKMAFYAQAEMGLEAAYAYTGRVMAENMVHRDTAEGVQAFLEKREPDWR
ncbi:Enoyl-CoA hydratase/carnithine racemase [Albimonas donghaensis]|uniref:Enoyl-CoA hydratase domain-containing protein 3, mitochondrial n=1 Tax=Albimonas donghaensis TaxID=356660 RepID=A0A1H2RP53_9RHOB|nr:enoyl-CoA hydratase [Albimonas donghaensis]SDW20544.1 Enoyl-CoA hydratase/carnithine racemase [Albimonas donghaensis]